MEKNNFAARLKEIRLSKDYTQKGLADMCKIPFKTLRNYEQGHSQPAAENLIRLAEVLEVTPEYLYGGKEKMEEYTKNILEEMKKLDINQIKTIRERDLSYTTLSRLGIADEIVSEIKEAWDDRVFKNSFCRRDFVIQIVLRYCQNRSEFKNEFNL